MSRGQQLNETVMALVILGIVVIIALTFVFKVGGVVDRSAEIQVCKATIAVAAKDPTNFIDINCPTDEVLIKQDGAYVRSLRSKNYLLFLPVSIAKDELKAKGIDNPDDKTLFTTFVDRVLANEAMLCWDKMGAGNLDPFKSALFQLSKLRCVSCAVIRLDDPVKQKVGTMTFGSLIEYFRNTKTSKGDKSILDYLHPSLINRNLDELYANTLDAAIQDGVTVSYAQEDTSTIANWVPGQYFAFTSIIPKGWNAKCDALY
jgi:hypothetical protein